MNTNSLSPELAVSELLDQHPELAPVFIHHRMACVGCDMAGFETLADAAQNYQLNVFELIAELEEALG